MRKYPRLASNIDAKITKKDISEETLKLLKTKIKDISKGGVYLTKPPVYHPGDVIELEFDLPGKNITVRAVGLVKWEDEEGMGVQFIKVSKKEKKSIEEFIEEKMSSYEKVEEAPYREKESSPEESPVNKESKETKEKPKEITSDLEEDISEIDEKDILIKKFYHILDTYRLAPQMIRFYYRKLNQRMNKFRIATLCEISPEELTPILEQFLILGIVSQKGDDIWFCEPSESEELLEEIENWLMKNGF